MRRLSILVLAVLATAPAAMAQSLIYDNTTTSLDNNFPLLPAWLNDSAEVGDDIWLGGTNRVVTQIKMLFFYRGTEPGTIDAIVRLRPLDELSQMPVDAIYDSGMIHGLPTVAGMNEYTFDIPNVVVPDHVVWTIQAYNRQGSVGELGPAYYNPPTVGFSDDFFWQSDMGSEWTRYSWGADPVANFGASITAVPEPATLFFVGTGLALVIRRRRSHRQQPR